MCKHERLNYDAFFIESTGENRKMRTTNGRQQAVEGTKTLVESLRSMKERIVNGESMRESSRSGEDSKLQPADYSNSGCGIKDGGDSISHRSTSDGL